MTALEWWTHKGSNLGPLPCEGNALPLSYASGIFVHRPTACQSALGTMHAVRASDLQRVGCRCQAVSAELRGGETGLIAESLAHPGSGPPSAFYAKAILLRQFKLCLPVQPLHQKYFYSHPTQITCVSVAVSSHWRGGSRSSRTRDGMRWTRIAPKTKALEADGEAVWS
jgi:hypothetical protein